MEEKGGMSVRVLFVENAGNMSAGAFHSMVTLIGILKQYGVESYVAVPDRADGLALLETNGIPYIKMRACSYTWLIYENDSFIEKIKMPIKYLYTQLASFKLTKYANEHHIDIVHENTSACYLGKFVADKLKLPHIWHIREFLEEDFGMTIWNKKRALKMMNSSAALITISDAVTNKYRKLVRQDLLHKIYNGISVDRFYQPERQVNIGEETKVLCVGRVCDGKGQGDVIQTLVQLKKKYNMELQLYIVGIYDDEYVAQIMNPAFAVNIAENIHFWGQCNNMSEIYSQMDILCMSSKKEAFGRVTVEAMLSGMLVVGSNSGGTSEIVIDRETGLLYEPGNIVDMAETFKYAVDHSDEMVHIAEKGRKYAMQRFDAERNAREIYELYKCVLSWG